jgi:hypothetical protein
VHHRVLIDLFLTEHCDSPPDVLYVTVAPDNVSLVIEAGHNAEAAEVAA